MAQPFFNNNTARQTPFNLAQRASTYVSQAIVKEYLDPILQRSYSFYQQNKSLILVLTAISLTYLLTKKSKKPSLQIEKKKKVGGPKNHISNKNFMSDQEVQYKQQESTESRRQGESSKESMIKKKKSPSTKLQKIESSQEEQQSKQKIFFEMYKTYQNSCE